MVIRDDSTPPVSELIEDRVMWLDHSGSFQDQHDADYDGNRPDDTVVDGGTETKFNPREGEDSGHEFEYTDLRKLDDGSQDLNGTEWREEHRIADAETWMSQLELPDSERERVKYLIGRLDFSKIGQNGADAVILALITIVISERDHNVGGWLWKKMGEIEKAVGVEHHEVLKIAHRLMESENFPSVSE